MLGNTVNKIDSSFNSNILNDIESVLYTSLKKLSLSILFFIIARNSI